MSTTFSVLNLPKLRYGTTAEVAAAPVSDGTVLVDTSAWRVYVDLGGRRLDLNTPVPVTTAANLPAQADRVPGKLYVALDTWTIYLSDGTAWHALEPWRYVADTELSDSSSNPVANKAVSAALKDKADLEDGKVPSNQLPLASYNSEAPGVVWCQADGYYGIKTAQGQLQLKAADQLDISSRSSGYRPVVPSNLNYAVTAALTDANHITLTAEQQATAKEVLGVADLPSGGTKGQALVASSDSGSYAWADKADLVDGTVPPEQLPSASGDYDGSYGIVRIYNRTQYGIQIGNTYRDLQIYPANNAAIDNRQYNRPITPPLLNYAVTAALTDAKHITLTAAQQATAKAVLGISEQSGWQPPSGATAGQLLAATSDSGVYAWVDPAFGGEAEAVTLWSADVPGQVSWASDMKSVTVSHSLSGSPSVVVLDGTGTRVYPTVTALPSAVLLSFGTAMSIPQSSPWTVALFGAEGAIASSGAPADLDDAVRAVLPAITEIPAATSAYSLLDASSDVNGHSAVYRHSPSAAPTYTLPDVEDDTVLHEITLSVLFSASVQTCTFQDSSGNTVTPLSAPHIGAGTVVSYLCRYESLLGRWCVMPVVMGTVEV